MSDTTRLQQQIGFLVEIDKLKKVLRQTWLLDQSRYENDAEHSWHIAVTAMLFREYADDPNVDLLRVIKMLLVHDLVEIDAGDTYAYDEKACLQQPEREQMAEGRIFSLLPPDQAVEFRGLWEEFEARQTPAARYAAALDRFQPLLHNYLTGGRAWLDHAVTADRVFARNRSVLDGAPRLGQYAEDLIRDAVAKRYLAPPEAMT
jgi:putative hydrolase of HD superfamily